jgi:hypothetical protein
VRWVSNPRFGAKEGGADLGKLNACFANVGAREDGAELATSNFLGPLSSCSTPGREGADVHDFGADRGGANGGVRRRNSFSKGSDER